MPREKMLQQPVGAAAHEAGSWCVARSGVRTIGADFIVPARSGKVPLPAFCVERSRWHRRHHESDAHFSKGSDLIASKKALLAMRLAKSQQDVWLSVDEEQELLDRAVHGKVRSDESPTSLQLHYETEHVTRAVDEYVTALEHAPAGAGGSVVGVAWSINGVPTHADRYPSPALFVKLWRKLLRAAATEAIVQRPPSMSLGWRNRTPFHIRRNERSVTMAEYETYDREQVYREQYRRFMRMEVPPCTRCGTSDTASVQVGVIGVTIRLAATCPKFKLIPNGPKPGAWFCNRCGRFFDVPYDSPEGATP